ncbi:maestro heat-like repeat-containing protein family member 1 [Puma concolor]|uniref:Maestro heat-like repeat-containing protein family member 1 n=1 Tax=Puma concolor TaxID=9696 RepID=A0A6P6HU38_PUMCO|nr:maestro heat-like repeat-containing protein family member 1 [Puma concolor]
MSARWGHGCQLAHPYRTMILRAMETVVSSHISDLDKDLARAVIFLASSEMTRVKVEGAEARTPGLPPANNAGAASSLHTSFVSLGAFGFSRQGSPANLYLLPAPRVSPGHARQGRATQTAVGKEVGGCVLAAGGKRRFEGAETLFPGDPRASDHGGKCIPICVPVESSSPLVVSNRKEVLRCFTVLACCSPDRLLAFLLPKLDANNERTRVGTLQVVRHVINSAASQMEVKKPFILSSMRLPLLDTNSKVKRAVVQVISAMAHHGYLEQPGGEAMVAYIVQQCALPPEAEPQKPGPDSEDPATDSVRDVSISTLYLVSTTVDRMSHDRSENDVEKVKSTLILCYGHVAARAPRELVLAKVESDILRNIVQYFSTKVLGIKVETKDPALKLCLIQSVCMASQAICSSAQAGSFHFSRKAELVAQMMEFIKAEPPDSLRTPIRKKAMLACTYLVSLEPALEERVQADLIRGCLHSVMAVLPEPEGEEDRQESLYLDTMHALEDLLTSLLRRNMTPQGLQIMVEHLSPWIRSPRGHERVRALGLSACLLQHFLEHLHVSALVPFHNLGLLIGLFSPRCADLWPATRQEAVSCVHALLYLQLGYEGFSRDYRDDVAEQLLALKEGLVHPDPTVLFHTCHSIAQIIAKRLPPEQLISLLLTLFESLGDPDKNCSRAATIMVNCLLRERGSMLQEKVPEIVSVLRSKLQETREEHVLQAAQHSVYLLASQHCAAVVSSLLGGPLPFDRYPAPAGLWGGRGPGRLGRKPRSAQTRHSRVPSAPRGAPAPLAPSRATCALHEVLSALESGPAVLELYPQLFAALLLRVSCTLGVLLPRSLQAKERRSVGSAVAPRSLEPCSCAVDALQAMLLRGGNEDVVRRVELEGGWQLLRTSAGHEEGVTRLASAMAKCAGPRLPLVMKALVCTQSSVYEIQRVTSTAFLAELLKSNVVNDLMLLESLLDNLAARQKDTSASVRRLVLRGLANIASSSPEKVQAHGPQLLTAMIGGLDDRDDPHSLVALEAMVGLARLLELVKRQDLRSVLLHVAIRIRPFFDSDIRNTVGNVPLEWYEDFPHVGYDLDGRRIYKPLRTRDELDQFLDKMDNPDYWWLPRRTVQDRTTGHDVRLTDEQVALVRRLQSGQFGDVNFDPYEPAVDFFSGDLMVHPVTNRPADKRSFIPSLVEKEKVSRMVHAIKMGWIQPRRPQDPTPSFYDLWAQEDPDAVLGRHKMHVPAPKLALPGHAESYNPPPEYLLSEDERLAWEQQEPGERRLNFLPHRFPSLRAVPAYGRFIQERFERCLDLYLCPRQRKMREGDITPLIRWPCHGPWRRPKAYRAPAASPPALAHAPGAAHSDLCVAVGSADRLGERGTLRERWPAVIYSCCCCARWHRKSRRHQLPGKASTFQGLGRPSQA